MDQTTVPGLFNRLRRFALGRWAGRRRSARRAGQRDRRTAPSAAAAGEPLARVLPFRRPAAALAPAIPPGDPGLVRVFETAELERRQVDEQLRDLLRLPRSRRQIRVRQGDRFRSWSLAARLLAESSGAGHPTAEAESLARLGLLIAEGLDPSRYGQRLIDDLKARCWATLGDVLRRRGDLAGAEEAFQRGAEHLLGAVDPTESISFLRSLARLRRDQGRHREALELLEEVAALRVELVAADRLAAVEAGEGYPPPGA